MHDSEFHEIEKELESNFTIENHKGYNLYSGISKKFNRSVSIKVISDIFNQFYGPKKIIRELQIYSQLNHENISNLINLKFKTHFNKPDSIFITSELLDTTLYKIILSNQELTEDHRRFFIYQILRALKYLHSANIIHKNIRPDNILLSANCDLKLQILFFQDFQPTNGTMIDRWYRSPEQLFFSESVSFPTDIWSVGCIFYEIIMRRPLFPGNSWLPYQLNTIINTIGSPEDDDLYYLTNKRYIDLMNRFQKVDKVNFSELVTKASKDEIDLIEQMLMWNPSKRISVDEALKHSYFEDLHDLSDEPMTSPIEPLNINIDENNKAEMKKCVESEIKKICENHNFI